jgi:hypothetical protein
LCQRKQKGIKVNNSKPGQFGSLVSLNKDSDEKIRKSGPKSKTTRKHAAVNSKSPLGRKSHKSGRKNMTKSKLFNALAGP